MSTESGHERIRKIAETCYRGLYPIEAAREAGAELRRTGGGEG